MHEIRVPRTTNGLIGPIGGILVRCHWKIRKFLRFAIRPDQDQKSKNVGPDKDQQKFYNLRLDRFVSNRGPGRTKIKPRSNTFSFCVGVILMTSLSHECHQSWGNLFGLVSKINGNRLLTSFPEIFETVMNSLSHDWNGCVQKRNNNLYWTDDLFIKWISNPTSRVLPFPFLY